MLPSTAPIPQLKEVRAQASVPERKSGAADFFQYFTQGPSRGRTWREDTHIPHEITEILKEEIYPHSANGLRPHFFQEDGLKPLKEVPGAPGLDNVTVTRPRDPGPGERAALIRLPRRPGRSIEEEVVMDRSQHIADSPATAAGNLNRTILGLDLGTSTGWTLRAPGTPSDKSEWRQIPGWPAYEVSSDGRVRRARQSKGALAGRVLRPLLNKKTGYLSVCLCERPRSKRIDVHRLVALTFLGHQPSPRHLVAHNDGDRTNNAARNLRWATQAENLSDCRAHHTALIGSRNPSTVINEIDVLAIRRMKVAGIPRPVIAEGYGLHKRSVFKILANSSWEHVQ